MVTLAEDVRGFPQYLRRSPRIWVPFGLLAVSFIIALLMDWAVLDTGLERLAVLFVQLTLPPTALFVFVLGGALAARLGYLVGATLGLVDGILWSTYVFWSTQVLEPEPTGSVASMLPDVVVITVVSVVIGTVAGGLGGLLVHVALGRPGRDTGPYVHNGAWTRRARPMDPWGSGVGPPPGWYGPTIPEEELPDTLIRTYEGTSERIGAERAADRTALAGRGYVVVSEVWVPKSRGVGAWLAAIILVQVVIGIFLLAWFLARPLGTLTATYRRQEVSSWPSPSGSTAPDVPTRSAEG